MSLSHAERDTTRDELHREFTAAGWSVDQIAFAARTSATSVRTALQVDGAAPADVWLVRDVLDAAVREAGGPPPRYTHLSESRRAAAEGWFGIRSYAEIRTSVARRTAERGVVLMADPAVTSIPVVECDEPLVEVGPGPRLGRDEARIAVEPVSALVRAGVLERLHQAAASLPAGHRLVLGEGYRRPDVQRASFGRYRAGLAEEHPQLDAAGLDALASRFISPPEVAPHCAGAAVDVTLHGPDGVALDLGTPIDANPEVSDGGCYTAAAGLPEHAQAHRRILVDALTGAGFVNYPTEWWHWSYGDRYWALATGAPHARYGTVTP